MSEININAMIDLYNQIITKVTSHVEVGDYRVKPGFDGSPASMVSQLLHDARVLQGQISAEQWRVERGVYSVNPVPSCAAGVSQQVTGEGNNERIG